LRQASQQLVVAAWQLPARAHDAASGETPHFVTPPADVRQHATAPGRPHVDFVTHRSMVAPQARGSERASSAARSTPCAHVR
jgi:hypothetical protein